MAGGHVGKSSHSYRLVGPGYRELLVPIAVAVAVAVVFSLMKVLGHKGDSRLKYSSKKGKQEV